MTTEKGDFQLYQVCHDLTHSETRKREIEAIATSAQELDLHEGYVITNDHEETIQFDSLTIYCIPFWKWGLQ